MAASVMGRPFGSGGYSWPGWAHRRVSVLDIRSGSCVVHTVVEGLARPKNQYPSTVGYRPVWYSYQVPVG
jgi:hypothetical protein